LLGLCLALGAASSPAAQTCQYDSIPATAPGSRFVDFGDGTVGDKATGLQWKRCSEGQTWSGSTCTGIASSHTWQAALQLAEGASDAGRSDWRLPNIKELASIVEQACVSPAIDLAAFPGTASAGYWSSSHLADDPISVLVERFDYGDDVSDSVGIFGYCIRLVRGGQ